MRPFRLRLIALAAVLTGALAAADDLRIVELDPPADLPEFALTDHTGRPFTPESLRGRWDLVLLGFTSCPDVCPFVLSNLADVHAELSTRVTPENLPRVVFVGVDPQRDRPVLGEYVGIFIPTSSGSPASRPKSANSSRAWTGSFASASRTPRATTRSATARR
jgi:protein SCO1/2